MIFCGSISGSGGASAGAIVPSTIALGTAPCASALAPGAGVRSALGEMDGPSRDARIREIGGSTTPFTALSSRFLRGFFSSISETLSITGRGAGVGGAVASGRAGAVAGATWSRAGFAGGATLSLFADLAFEAAGLTVLPAVGLRTAFLIVVFVGISVPLKFRSWLERFKRSHFSARHLVDGSPRGFRAPLLRRLRGCPQNPVRPQRASLPNW